VALNPPRLEAVEWEGGSAAMLKGMGAVGKLAVVGAVVLLAGNGGAQAEDPPTAARRAWVAGRLYAAVQLYFAHWRDVPPLDFDQAFADYLEEAMAAPDRRAFSMASQAFLVRLTNSHTSFHDRRIEESGLDSHGFRARYLDGSWIVSSSDRADLAPGDAIVAVAGRPIEVVYQEMSRYISASTDRYRRRALFYSRYSFLFPREYTLTLGDDREVTILRGPRAADAETAGRWLSGGLAYLRVPSWTDPRFERRALELLEIYRDAAGLIVDVRGNNGGSTPERFIAALMDRSWRSWAESTPARFALFSYYASGGQEGFGDFAGMHLSWPAPSAEGKGLYRGPLTLLVDEGCHSACEDFVMPFKDNSRATLIGETTAGSTGQTYWLDLGDGMGALIGIKREYFPDGSRFEGVGIEPDLRVLPTRVALASGLDAELERAAEELRRREPDGE
jgi:carboxyl-terminal processing protease